MKQAVQNLTGTLERTGRAVGLLDLTDNLVFADYHRVDTGGNAEQVAGSMSILADIETVPQISDILIFEFPEEKLRYGERFAVGGGKLWVGRNDGRDPVLVGDPSEWGGGIRSVTFDPEGRYLAFLTGLYDFSTAVFRVWNLESDTEQATLQLPGAEFRYGVSFSSDGRLLTATTRGVVAWDVESGQHEILVEEGVAYFTASRNGRRLLQLITGGLS